MAASDDPPNIGKLDKELKLLLMDFDQKFDKRKDVLLMLE